MFGAGQRQLALRGCGPERRNWGSWGRQAVWRMCWCGTRVEEVIAAAVVVDVLFPEHKVSQELVPTQHRRRLPQRLQVVNRRVPQRNPGLCAAGVSLTEIALSCF